MSDLITLHTHKPLKRHLSTSPIEQVAKRSTTDLVCLRHDNDNEMMQSPSLSKQNQKTIPVVKKDKGKGKMRYLPDLPQEVWQRIFELYYEDCYTEWDRTGTMRYGLSPLLLDKQHTEIALPILYRHPHLNHHAIQRFISSVYYPARYNALNKTSYVRYLTVRPSIPPPPGPSQDVNAAASPEKYTMHPSFPNLMGLLPHITTLTIKDTLLLYQSDATILFDGLRAVTPKKARIEIRAWDLNNSPVGQDILSATRAGVHTPYSGQRTYLGQVNDVNPWRDHTTRFVQELWRDALYDGTEFHIPFTWYEVRGVDGQLVQPSQNPNPNPIINPLAQHLATLSTANAMTQLTTHWTMSRIAFYSNLTRQIPNSTLASLLTASRTRANQLVLSQAIQQPNSAAGSRVDYPTNADDDDDDIGSTVGDTGTPSNESQASVAIDQAAHEEDKEQFIRDVALALANEQPITSSEVESSAVPIPGEALDNGRAAATSPQQGPSWSVMPRSQRAIPAVGGPPTFSTAAQRLPWSTYGRAGANPNGNQTGASSQSIVPVESSYVDAQGRRVNLRPGGGHIGVQLAHFLRGLLVELITRFWSPQIQAFSFVAMDPLASLVVRSPSLDFWPQIAVRHIRVQLPRACNPLSIFKGPKEAIRERERAQAQLINPAVPLPAPQEEIQVVGGDGLGSGLVHDDVRLFEVEINTVAEMKDDVWIRYGSQLPPQLCRILAGMHDWRDVSIDISSHNPSNSLSPYPQDIPSPSTSEFDSPTFSFATLDENDDVDEDLDISSENGKHEGNTYDAEKAAEQARRMGMNE